MEVEKVTENVAEDAAADKRWLPPHAYFADKPVHYYYTQGDGSSWELITYKSPISLDCWYGITLLFGCNILVNLVCIWCALASQYSIKPSGCSNFDTSKWPSSAAYNFYQVEEGVALPVPTWYINKQWNFESMLKLCPLGAVATTYYGGNGKIKSVRNDRCLYGRNNFFANIDADNAAAGVSTHLADSYAAIESARSLIMVASIICSCLLPFMLYASVKKSADDADFSVLSHSKKRDENIRSWICFFALLVVFALSLGALILTYVDNDFGNSKAWSTTWFIGCDEVIVSKGSAFSLLVYILVSVGIYIFYSLFMQYEGITKDLILIEEAKRTEIANKEDIELEIANDNIDPNDLVELSDLDLNILESQNDATIKRTGGGGANKGLIDTMLRDK